MFLIVVQKNTDIASRDPQVVKLKGSTLLWNFKSRLMNNYSQWPISQNFGPGQNTNNFYDTPSAIIRTPGTTGNSRAHNPVSQLFFKVLSGINC